MDSYGYIETYGYVTSIVAADEALKAADVTLTNLYFVKSGIVTVEFVGDVASVKIAIEVGSECAKRLGNYLSSNVIARMDSETKKILKKEEKSKTDEECFLEEKSQAEEVLRVEILENSQEEETLEVESIENSQEEELLKEKDTKENKVSEEKEVIKKLRKKYQDMRVIELKTKVNKLKTEYTWNQIKGMTKKKLIEILIKYNQEE